MYCNGARDRWHRNQRGDPRKEHEPAENDEPRNAGNNLQHGISDTALEKPNFQADKKQHGEDKVRVNTGEEGTLLAGSETGNGDGVGVFHRAMIAQPPVGGTLLFLARGWN